MMSLQNIDDQVREEEVTKRLEERKRTLFVRGFNKKSTKEDLKKLHPAIVYVRKKREVQ